MANERITENFFRKFVLQDNFYLNNKIIFEEQSSKDIKINKLLKNASKGGNGKGYPEFVIQFKENPDFIIVVECKADSKFHESKNRDKYKDYAVDGALLYSSFLSKEFDVLSIAISGESKSNLKISHFLQLKDTEQYHKIFKDDSFLPLEDYLNGYQTDEKKFNQDLQELLKYSKTLNDNLHILKVPESDRSLLISGALIALHDKAFCKAYKYQKPKELAENLINTIKNKLTDVQNKHIEDIITSYSFIKTHTILSKQENKLRDIIESVDKKINNFIKTYKYFDTLGQFYIEFLRYANNDKGLGIVLTPPHITELFCEIANVNKDSVVLDTCTGTGGFLISAMKKMIIDAGADKKKELEIKSKQIIGIELQHSIFSLTCSNMYIHGDGRSNLIKGSCFDEKIIEQVKKYKPNVGFLNPPYKSSKDDIEELEFILNNLSMLEKGSYCIAIVPMGCIIEDKKNNVLLKEKLLQNHTLEAVFSMPNDLFHNSDVSVHTSIIVFKAKEKHPENYKTYFGYWKNDGFIKIKHIGRTDFYDKWKKIKKEWIDNYRNKDEILGHSIKKSITAENQWSIETYMKTDYRDFKDEDFIETIHNFIGFQFSRHNIKKIEDGVKLQKLSNLNLFGKKWEYFQYDKVFDHIGRGKRLIKNHRKSGNTLYFSASEFNNGCTDKIGNPLFVEKDAIIYTTFGDSYYVKGEFTASDEISIFKNKRLNIYNGLFISTVISKNKYKYYFGRKAFRNKFMNDFIALPVDKNGNLDWEFMENYIRSLPYSSNL